MDYSGDIQQCIKTINKGGLILYPTDTIWGIGCDATNEQAVSSIFALKQRTETKSMIILLSNKDDIAMYVVKPDPEILNYISKTSLPTTAVYENGRNVADGLINEDGTIAIRITRDEFCFALINKFRKPLVSTSANISGKSAPHSFSDISDEIKNGVDYIVQHRQFEHISTPPSAIIKLNRDGSITKIR
jgi:L-threonylcarbamoyladenylate synthase